MAVLDAGHVALAHIISRGNSLATSGCLSVSIFGPDPAYAMCPEVSLDQQQLWQADPDLHNSTYIHCAGPLSGTGSVQYLDMPSPAPTGAFSSPYGSPSSAWSAPMIGPHASGFPAHPAQEQRFSSIPNPGALSRSSPTWAPCADLQQQQAAGMPVPVQRSHSAALSSHSSSADVDECSTPRGQIIPAELPAPCAPRAPRPTARLLMPCEPQGRLQQWLNSMELKLAVPTGLDAPGSYQSEEPSHAPKATSGTYPARRPALTVTEVRNVPGAFTGPYSSTITGKCAAPAASNAAAGQLSSSITSPGARKRGMQEGVFLLLCSPAPADSADSCCTGNGSD